MAGKLFSTFRYLMAALWKVGMNYWLY